MSIYFIIIIGVILFQYILSSLVTHLNLKALDPNLPEEFADTFDEEKYIKSQEYTRTNSRFSYITSSISLIISLIFILGGFYNVVDLYVRGFGYGEVLTGICFFGNLDANYRYSNSTILFVWHFRYRREVRI